MNENEIITTEYKLGIIPAKTPHDVIVQATIIAKELAKLIKDNRLSRQIQGREYVYVEGWSTMGAMLGVLPREVFAIRNADGSYEATVELIRITDGAVIGRASAFVGMDEKDRSGKLTWGNRPEYARRSMAVTRATGKAYRLGFSWIMGLAGYAPTPAEEMDDVIEGEFREHPGNGKAVVPAPVAATDDPPKMSLDTAMDVTGSDGVRYGEASNDDLAKKSIGIGKALKKNGLTPEQREAYQFKMDAIQTILWARRAAAEPPF